MASGLAGESRKRLTRALGLFGLLVAVYFFTFHGQPFSSDELFYFDAARSFAVNGTFELSYTNDLQNYRTPPGDAPAAQLQVEPLHIQLLGLLIAIARNLPGVGLIQAAYLLNIFATALTGVVIYFYGLALGYRDRTALTVALLFGLATLAWPYSQMLFREPPLTLFCVLCLYAAERLRGTWGEVSHPTKYTFRRDPGEVRYALLWAAVGLLAYLGAAAVKDAGLLLVPALLLALYPARLPRRVWQLALPAALIGGAALLLIGGARGAEILSRVSRPDFVDAYLSHAPEALPAYLISPGFSVWAFSPVLLIGFAGLLRLWRARRFRQILVPLTILLSFAVVHATVHGPYWYGGLGYGPRFLVPAVAFLVLWLLPALEPLLNRPPRVIWPWLPAGALIALSLVMQWNAVTTPILAYSNFLSDESQRLGQQIVAWREGVWDARYLPQVVTARLAHEVPSPLSWVQVAGAAAVAIPLCALAALVSGYVMLRPPERWWAAALALLASLAIMLGGGLRAYYRDVRYGGSDPTLWKVRDALRASLRPGDAIILSSRTYRPFFMNYYKGDAPIYTLPNAQGELLNPGETPYVVSDYQEERAEPVLQIMLARIAARSQRWWYLTEYTPFMINRYRVTESYLARHYFPVEEVISEERARLILYAPVSAPPESALTWPAYPVNADFGAATLVGFDAPRGLTTKPGHLLPISLLWRHDGWPADLEPFDYSVNLSLRNGDGSLRTERAAGPMGTFGRMSLWQPGYYRDNHALRLPDDTPPGEYVLWALVFDWRVSRLLPLRNLPGDYVVLATVRVE